jgi:hypothetical protein
MGDIRPNRLPRPRCRARLWGPLLGSLLLLRPVAADAAEPLITILKNMLLGGAVGTILGGSVTLVVHEDARADAVRWGAVIGTFGGFTIGVLLALQGEEDLFGTAPIESSMPRAGAPAAQRGASPMALASAGEGRMGPAAGWLDTYERSPRCGDDARVELVLLRFTGSPEGARR